MLAVPAAAQEVPFDSATLEACLAEGAGADCIGRGAAACMEGDFGGSNASMSLCWRVEGDWWDAELNRTYAALIELRTERDDELRELGSAAPPTVHTLREMQRAWIAFRDAACAYEFAQWSGGTGGNPAHAACAMRLTAEQTLALQARLDERR